MAIKFYVGSADRYTELKNAGSLSAESFYRISGTNDMYIGTRKLTSEEDVQKALNSIGNLEGLTTEEKSNLVAALNEVKASLADAVTNANVTIETAASPSGADYAKTYELYQGKDATHTGRLIGKIDIPKELVVQSGEVVTNPDAQHTGTFIKLVIQNQEAPLFINVADLVDVYQAQTSATSVQLEIGEGNIISATIVDGAVSAAKIATDAVTTDKIKDKNVTKAKLSDEVQASLGKADTAVQSVVATGAAGTNGTITVDGTEVAVKGLGSAAYTDSTAYATAAQGTLAASALQKDDIAEGATDGTIAVEGTDVKVHGLGSAAYTAASDYATSAQGAKADTALQKASITSGTAQGTISVGGTNVAVNGLGNAAYTDTTAYATAAQGEKADSAVQTVASGSENGTIAVDGTNVQVKGLLGAAYKAENYYDIAGTAATEAGKVVGTAEDTKDANTVIGAKKYADSIVADAALVWETM